MVTEKGRKAPHLAALERLWNDRCSVYCQEKVTDPDTHLTDFREQVLAEGLPCKLSFETLTTAEKGHAAATEQKGKLFLSADVDIPAGSKIVVTRAGTGQTGREFAFCRSGLAGIFRHHQEIYLDTFRGYA
jgi:hypothetical protein